MIFKYVELAEDTFAYNIIVARIIDNDVLIIKKNCQFLKITLWSIS
jgi:hypothetical protein